MEKNKKVTRGKRKKNLQKHRNTTSDPNQLTIPYPSWNNQFGIYNTNFVKFSNGESEIYKGYKEGVSSVIDQRKRMKLFDCV